MNKFFCMYKMLSFISDLEILVKEVIDRTSLPDNFEDNSSSKMLASVEYNQKEWCSDLINHQKITKEDVKQFILSSIENVVISSYHNDENLTLSFGLIYKVEGLYYSISTIITLSNGKCHNFMTSLTNKASNKDKFERWSGMIYENRKPQIDENGEFI
jgi:hypothetical protein